MAYEQRTDAPIDGCAMTEKQQFFMGAAFAQRIAKLEHDSARLTALIDIADSSEWWTEGFWEEIYDLIHKDGKLAPNEQNLQATVRVLIDCGIERIRGRKSAL